MTRLGLFGLVVLVVCCSRATTAAGRSQVDEVRGTALPGREMLFATARALDDSTTSATVGNNRRLLQQPIIAQGCSQGSCNPQGGDATSNSNPTQSTTVEQAEQDSGNPLTDIVGTIGTVLGARGGGRKLMQPSSYSTLGAAVGRDTRKLFQIIAQGCTQGSCNPQGGEATSNSNPTQTTNVEQPAQDSGNPLTDIVGTIGGVLAGRGGGRKLMRSAVVSISNTLDAGGYRQLLQCVDADHQAECRSWGRSSCGLPGVNDKCPCMCGGGAPGPNGGGDIIIVNEVEAVGCKDNSCNPGGGDATSTGGK